MLIIFIVLAGVWITCGTIFVVREIEIVDLTVNAKDAITENEKADIIKNSGLNKKNILFSLNQEEIEQGVKLVNPMIKLQTVTAQFPSRVVLKLSRRLPIYYDSKNELYFDAEMCRVDGTKADCIEITQTNLALAGNLKFGDPAVGKDLHTQCKINQLKVIATYFDKLDGLKISYDDDAEDVGSQLICLNLEIKAGVTFQIKIKHHADFLHALEYTNQIYQDQKIEGVYKTRYREDGKVNTVIGDKKYCE